MSIRVIISVLLAVVFSSAACGNHWIGTAPLNSQREGITAVVLNGEVYAIGGSAGPGLVFSTVEKYNVDDDSWIELSSLNHPRSFAAAAVAAGKIFVFGGRVDANTAEPVVEMYDPSFGIWVDVQTMLYPREGLQAVTVGNEIWVIGGYSPTIGYTGTVDIFNPVSYIYQVGEMSAIFPARVGHAAAIAGNEIRIIGGLNFIVLGSHTSWNDSSWVENEPVLPTPKFNLGAEIVGGKLLAIGGNDGELPVNTVEWYDLQTGIWEDYEPMIFIRESPATVLLGDTVMAIGGYGSATARYGYLASCEILPPPEISVENGDLIAMSFSVNCYPNPFNTGIRISIDSPISASGCTELTIYNSLGQRVFFQGAGFKSGNNSFIWNGVSDGGRTLPSGIYFIEINMDEYQHILPVIMIK